MTDRVASAAATTVHFGSAHLFVGGMTETTAAALLEAAAAAGATRFDTAPLYGHGRSELLVAAAAHGHPGIAVTTKVGLEPAPPPAPWRRLAGSLIDQLPAAWRDGLRSARRGRLATPVLEQPSGRFACSVVERSIERSLSRLGAIDRLLLHEVHPADVDDELLALLEGYRRRGDVGRLGVATGNAVTAAALRRSHGLFTIAHVSVDPFGAALPDTRAPGGVQLVGHGVLGAEGHALARWRRHLASDPRLRAGWDEAVAATPFSGRDGEASALVARAAGLGLGELIVATRRPERVAAIVGAASGRSGLPAAARAMLERFIARDVAPVALQAARS